jgi:hypothetical protein
VYDPNAECTEVLASVLMWIPVPRVRHFNSSLVFSDNDPPPPRTRNSNVDAKHSQARVIAAPTSAAVEKGARSATRSADATHNTASMSSAARTRSASSAKQIV